MRSTFAKNSALSVSMLAAVALTGCIGTLHGGGVVELFDVSLGGNPGQPGNASLGLSVTCNDRTNLVTGVIAWNDNTNGVQFNAHLHKVPIAELLDDTGATCDEAADIVDAMGASAAFGIINTRGEETGEAVIAVSKPGAPTSSACGELQAVIIEAMDPSLPGGYLAQGCLEHGTINFKD
jgi:hypothetical protein